LIEKTCVSKILIFIHKSLDVLICIKVFVISCMDFILDIRSLNTKCDSLKLHTCVSFLHVRYTRSSRTSAQSLILVPYYFYNNNPPFFPTYKHWTFYKSLFFPVYQICESGYEVMRTNFCSRKQNLKTFNCYHESEDVQMVPPFLSLCTKAYSSFLILNCMPYLNIYIKPV